MNKLTSFLSTPLVKGFYIAIMGAIATTYYMFGHMPNTPTQEEILGLTMIGASITYTIEHLSIKSTSLLGSANALDLFKSSLNGIGTSFAAFVADGKVTGHWADWKTLISIGLGVVVSHVVITMATVSGIKIPVAPVVTADAPIAK